MELLGGDAIKSSIKESSSFYFAVDTCANIAKATGDPGTNCKSNEESLSKLEFVGVEWKIFNQFFSAATYVEKDENLSYAIWDRI